MPLPAAARGNPFTQRLFTPLPTRYDRLAEVLSFGQNAVWRRAMVDRIVPAPGQRILDVASGTAGVALQLARRTGAVIVGVDLAEQLPFPDQSFDSLTFTYLLRYVQDPQATLAELARVVKPGARVASLEFMLPPRPVFRLGWWLYTRLLLPAGGYLTGGREWYDVGRFLGPNISGHYRRYPVSWTVRAWRQAGFEHVGYQVMSMGAGLVMWGTRAGE
jgi:demethylmenaquinone methyltransferase/2-methoxy-6-polyprenyl-1,4-benzoquinol methylase